MKKNKLILCLLLICVSNLVSGQTLTADELLEKSLFKNFDCINDFMIIKGFTFDKSRKGIYYSVFEYSSDKPFTIDTPMSNGLTFGLLMCGN